MGRQNGVGTMQQVQGELRLLTRAEELHDASSIAGLILENLQPREKRFLHQKEKNGKFVPAGG